MNLPGFGFHALKGNRKGTYSVSVSGNLRVTFRFEGEDAIDVDLEDYQEMALRLSKLLNTSPESWMTMQTALSIWEARQAPDVLKSVKPLPKKRTAETVE